MYKPVEIRESLTPAGESDRRTIIFSSVLNNDSIIRSFENGHSTILLGGRLYDWYGREVVVDDICAEIVMPFGFETVTAVCPNHMTRVAESYDRYIVRLIHGSYAISAVWKTINHEVKKPASSSLLNYPIPRWCLTRALPRVTFDELISTRETAQENPNCDPGSVMMVLHDPAPAKEQQNATFTRRSILVSPKDSTSLIYKKLTQKYFQIND